MSRLDTASCFRSSAPLSLALICIFASTLSQAFAPDVHKELTGEALLIVVNVAGQQQTFSVTATKEVKASNALQDQKYIPFAPLPVFSETFFDPKVHFDDEQFGPARARILALRSEILALLLLTGEGDGAARAREKLGAALHTIQDFYSHSTWVESVPTGTVDFTSTALLSSPLPTCDQSTKLPGTLVRPGAPLTTGYFSLAGDVELIAMSRGKCQHGKIALVGIHKDDPSRKRFGAARGRAVEASRQFVLGIISELQAAGRDDAVIAFLDANPIGGCTRNDSIVTCTIVGSVAFIDNSLGILPVPAAIGDRMVARFRYSLFADNTSPAPSLGIYRSLLSASLTIGRNTVSMGTRSPPIVGQVLIINDSPGDGYAIAAADSPVGPNAVRLELNYFSQPNLPGTDPIKSVALPTFLPDPSKFQVKALRLGAARGNDPFNFDSIEAFPP